MVQAASPFPPVPDLTPSERSFRKVLYIGIGVWVTLMFLFLAACIIIDWH